MYSNIFQTDDGDNSLKRNDHDFDIDDDYDNISIPFECSIPNRELEAFLRETHKKDEKENVKQDEDLRHFETFSPNMKMER